jgi:hypothetical protein
MCQGTTEIYPGAHVEYSFRIQEVTFEPFSIPLNDPRITEVRFTRLETDDPEENNCTMILILGPVTSIEEADQLADSIKDRLLEFFSLIIGCRVGRTRRIGHNLVPRPGEGGQMHGILPAIRIQAIGYTAPRLLTNNDIRSLQYAFSLVNTVGGCSLLRIFRHAMNIDDEVSRFLMLYLVLYLLRSNQRHVDELIRAIDPTVDQTPDPRNPSVNETCYTRLRNEITHRDVDHESTRQEILQRTNDLTNIVRAAIRQEYQL